MAGPYDPAWDMPQQNWLQQGSYESGQLPPITDPASGDGVCIGPFNRDWLPFVLGAMDQLRNPSSWIVADDDAMYATLARVDSLRQIFGEAGACVTCPEMRLQDCVLQISCDSGATWTDVSGWSDNFRNCVQAAIPPTVPPPVGSPDADQRACNLSGYLATKVIQETMVAAHTVLAASGTELQFGIDVMSLIGFAFPITYSAILAFHDFFNYLSGQSLTEINTAATDPTLWSEVTCAIFCAIRGIGYVTAANFNAVATNLGAISYVYPWVAPSLHNYWNELGLANIQAQQAVGALDSVDCSACTCGWCYTWDFTASDGGWSTPDLPHGAWVPGLGWQAGLFDPTYTALWLFSPIAPFAFAPSFITWTVYLPEPAVGITRHTYIYNPPGTVVATGGFPTGSNSVATAYSIAGFGTGVQFMGTADINGFGGTQRCVITRVTMTGTGVCPWGTPNC